MKDPCDITPVEFEILEILWNQPSALSVAQVTEGIRDSRPVAYTTVMTILDKLAKKGSVTRVKKGKAFFYTPSVRRTRVMHFLLRSFVDAYWGGDRDRLTRFMSEVNAPRNSERSKGKTPAVSRSPGAQPESSPQNELEIELL